MSRVVITDKNNDYYNQEGVWLCPSPVFGREIIAINDNQIHISPRSFCFVSDMKEVKVGKKSVMLTYDEMKLINKAIKRNTVSSVA